MRSWALLYEGGWVVLAFSQRSCDCGKERLPRLGGGCYRPKGAHSWFCGPIGRCVRPARKGNKRRHWIPKRIIFAERSFRGAMKLSGCFDNFIAPVLVLRLRECWDLAKEPNVLVGGLGRAELCYTEGGILGTGGLWGGCPPSLPPVGSRRVTPFVPPKED